MGAFDYTTNGVTMPAHSCITPWGAGEWTVKFVWQNMSGRTGWYVLTHNTPKHFKTCHKINDSIVPYKTVDILQNSYFIIDKYPKCYNKYIIQNKYEYYDE